MKKLHKGLWNCDSRALRRIITRWQRLNEEQGSDWIKYYEDAPWWYNERASLSFFCGAIWLSGGWVFEEFVAEKKSTRGKRNKRRYIGRCDIEFGIGKKKFLVEAKQCWSNIGAPLKNTLKRIESHLKKACQESKQTYAPADQHIGVVFACPLIHKSKREHLDLELEQFVVELRKLRQTTIAWVFPNAARNLRPSGKNRNYIYPGAVLLIRCAQKPRA